MRRFLAQLAAACVALALPALAQAEEPITAFSCSKEPGGSCTYKPTVKGLGVYRLTCTSPAAEPAPKVAVSAGPKMQCSSRVFPGDHTDVSCAAVNAEITRLPGAESSGSDTIQIVVTCEAK